MSEWTPEAKAAQREYMSKPRQPRPAWADYEAAPTAWQQARREYNKRYREKQKAKDPEGYAAKNREYQRRYWQRVAERQAAEKKSANDAEWAAYLAEEAAKERGEMQ